MAVAARSMAVAKKIAIYSAAIITDPVTSTASMAKSMASLTTSVCTNISTATVQGGWRLSASAADTAAHTSVKAALCTYRIARSVAKTGAGLCKKFLQHCGFLRASDPDPSSLQHRASPASEALDCTGNEQQQVPEGVAGQVACGQGAD